VAGDIANKKWKESIGRLVKDLARKGCTLTASGSNPATDESGERYPLIVKQVNPSRSGRGAG